MRCFQFFCMAELQILQNGIDNVCVLRYTLSIKAKALVKGTQAPFSL